MVTKYKRDRKELLVELYLEIVNRGPGFGSSIEFWDPTLETLIIFEEIERTLKNEQTKGENEC